MITPKSFMIRFCSFCFTTSYYTSFFFVIILSIINVCPINVIFMVLCIINSMNLTHAQGVVAADCLPPSVITIPCLDSQ